MKLHEIALFNTVSSFLHLYFVSFQDFFGKSTTVRGFTRLKSLNKDNT